MAVELTRTVRLGDAHASYTVTERAELMRHRTNGAYAFMVYEDATCCGLHTIHAGRPMDVSNFDEWASAPAESAAVQAIVSEWMSDGWELAS